MRYYRRPNRWRPLEDRGWWDRDRAPVTVYDAQGRVLRVLETGAYSRRVEHPGVARPVIRPGFSRRSR